jgi:hypothetical protein
MLHSTFVGLGVNERAHIEENKDTLVWEGMTVFGGVLRGKQVRTSGLRRRDNEITPLFIIGGAAKLEPNEELRKELKRG